MSRVRLGPTYVRLWLATTVSNLGDGVTLAATPLLAASLTRDPAAIAAIALVSALPWTLFALLGGAIADRVDRRWAMAAADGFRMMAIGGLGAAVLFDAQNLMLVGAIAFFLGCAEVVFDNAAQAILPSIVGRDVLETANGRLYAGEIVANQFAGPPLGSVLFALVAAAPFLLDAASFGIAAVLVITLRPTRSSFRPSRAEMPTIGTDIADGIRWLWKHRLLRTLALALGVWNLLETAVLSTLVLYALTVLDLSEAEYGALLTAGAAGAFLGSLVASRLAGWMGAGRLILGAVFVSAIATAVPAVWANPWAVGASFAVTAGAGVCWNVVTVSLRQAIVPDELLGRVNSAYRLLGWGMMPIGALLGGVLASSFGLRAPFWFGAIGGVALGVAISPFVNGRTVAAARREATP